MSTNFDTNFMNGDVIEADHVSQFAVPINTLEGEMDTLQTQIVTKSNVGHTHNMTEVAGLTTALDGKEDSLPTGVDGQLLQADSAAPTGVSWVNAPTGGGGTAQSPGDLLYTYQSSPSGYVEANGQLLSQSLYPALFGLVGLIVDSTIWQDETSPTTMALNSSVYGNGIFVAAGSQSTILSSSDGSVWSLESTPTTEALESVAFGNGLFVAVGSNGTILTSSNGTTWTSQSSSTTETLKGVAYGNSLFVAVGTSGIILTSSDGSSWSSQTTPGPDFMTDVAFGSGRFVAVGFNATVWSSANGTSWTAETVPISSWVPLQAIAFGNSVFVAVGGGDIISSSDGSTWSEATISSVLPSQLLAIGHGDGQLLAFYSNYNGKGLLSSQDGLSFGPILFPATSTDYRGIASDGSGTVVMVGDSGSLRSNQADPYSYDESIEFLMPDISSPAEGMKAWLKT